MTSLSRRIDARVRMLVENVGDYSWKDPASPTYDRQTAEDALYYTIGPLTDNPKWAGDWEDPNGVRYSKGSPAPQWTQEEIAYAFAGDTSLLYSSPRPPKTGDNASVEQYEKKLRSSPKYGNKGGSPMWRTAVQMASRYGRPGDNQFIMDMFGNGYIELVKLMQKGYDQSRSAFIPWVIAAVRQAMENGVGGTLANKNNALGAGTTENGPKGLKALLNVTSPEEAREIAGNVKGEFRTKRSHEKHDDNYFGVYSPEIFKAANDLADLLDAGNEAAIDRYKNSVILPLIDKIDDETQLIPGASTGAGQAITIGDRKSGVGISSADVSNDESGQTLGSTIAAKSEEVLSSVAPEAINFLLKQALTHDYVSALRGKTVKGQSQRDSKFLKVPEGSMAKEVKGGTMTANEFRVILRYFGLGPDYYGHGVVRSNLKVAREDKNWFKPGEDPEIEPLPNGEGLWKSEWLLAGCPQIRQTSIADEFTQEAANFKEIGVPTVRNTVGKVAVDLTLKSGMGKLVAVANIYRDRLFDWDGGDGLDESINVQGFPLLENISPVDAKIIVEAADYVIDAYRRVYMGALPIRLGRG